MNMPDGAVPAPVLAQLEKAAGRGFLGPRAVGDHAVHAVGFARALQRVRPGWEPASACDLGSGGGVPGLVLAAGCWPACRWTLVDAMGKRCAFLEEAVAALGLTARVTVECGRIEELARPGGRLRSGFDLVTARGFGPPAATAEAAAALLQSGSMLVVSEPPGSGGDRWEAEGCDRVGLRLVEVVQAAGAGYAVLELVRPPDERYPRAPKAQRRSPLF